MSGCVSLHERSCSERLVEVNLGEGDCTYENLKLEVTLVLDVVGWPWAAALFLALFNGTEQKVRWKNLG